MFCFSRSRFLQALVACVLLVSLTSVGRSQLLAPGQWPWPASCYSGTTWDGFHLLCDTAAPVCAINDAAMRITLGSSWTEPIFAQLGVVDSMRAFGGSYWHPWFSAIAPIHSTVLRSSWGDLVLSATTCLPSPTHAGPPPHASIHFGTTPSPPATDTTVEEPWDMERMTLWWDGKAAIGTQGTLPSLIVGDSSRPGEYDLLHLHVPCIPLSYNVDTTQGYAQNQLATLKLSYGGITNPQIQFAQLGFDRNHQLASFSSNEDLVLSTSSDQSFGPAGSTHGDMIFSNRRIGKALRFGTTYDTGETPGAITDAEHVAIMSNGNIAIDVPPDSTTGLMKAMDQVQIGGGTIAYPGQAAPDPGLTIYGGNQFEGRTLPSGKTAPWSYRYISYNGYQNHITGKGGRFVPLGASAIYFSDLDTVGMIQLTAIPWWRGDSLSDLSGGMTLNISGGSDSTGLSIWSDEKRFHPGDTVLDWKYFHELDIDRPDTAVKWDTAGMTLINTPLYVGKVYRYSNNPPFPGFPSYSIQPDMGGTWLMAVDGPALFKEAYVNETDWPDYVFTPGYNLKPIEEVEKYTEENHHLPDLPSANTIAKSGVPLGRTEAALTKQMEEMMLYIEQQNHRIDTLEAEVKELKSGKEQ